MVSVSNPMTRGAELPEEGGSGLSKTRTNATVKQLQAEMGLLNVKLAQQQTQQREEVDRLREEAAQQREELARQRQEMSRLMAIVESTVVSSSVGAAEDGISSLPEGWKALKTEDGKIYYEKPDHSTTWDLP